MGMQVAQPQREQFLKDLINLECIFKMAHSLLLWFLSRLACMKGTRKIIYFDTVPTFFLGVCFFFKIFLFLTSSVFSHFHFVSLGFIIYLACVVKTARCGLAD